MSIRPRSDRPLAPAALAVLAALALLLAPSAARADDDLEVFRERFRAGMEKYKAGQLADAIVEWEAIYRELGPKRGYRLAFNLGRAYDAYGDSTRAAEKLEAYLAEVDARRAAGEELEALVLKQETESRERLAELARTRARVKTSAARPTAVQIDSGETRLSGATAYLAPGEHTVTFEPGTASARAVVVRAAAGEEVVAADPGPPAAANPPPPPPTIPVEIVTVRPFPGWIMAVAGGAAVASVIAPVLGYDHALSIRDQHDASTDPAERARLEGDYSSAKTTAYATLAIPITLAAATGGLAAWWFFGSKEREKREGPRVTVLPGGLVGRF